MYCKNCGNQLSDTALCCDQCGTSVNPAPENAEERNARTPILVWGIISAALCQTPVAGIIVSLIARSKVKKHKAKYGNCNGTAMIGEILSLVGLIVSIVSTVVVAAFFLFYIFMMCVIFFLSMMGSATSMATILF